MTDVSTFVSTLTKVAEARLLSFPLRDIFDLNCWLALIPAPDLDSYGVHESGSELTASLSHLEGRIGQIVVKAKCTDCSSPRMIELTDLVSSTAARNETIDVIGALLDYATRQRGEGFLQVQIDRVLNQAARKCPHSPTYDPETKPFLYETFEGPNINHSTQDPILITVLIVSIVTMTLTVAFAVKCIVRRRHRRWLLNLDAHQMKSLRHHQISKKYFEDKLDITTRSMFQSPDIPCILRFAIPIIIVCNIFFFLTGHLSLGATVDIRAAVAGEEIVIEKLFEFSMARSTIDIWQAGGQGLAILILLFSGIWPYSKLLITLWLWFAPPIQVSTTRRGAILLWLDWLAKWSMLDIFVFVITVIAFRISVKSPDASYLPDNFYAIGMMVIPRWGLYANLIAQLMSQVTSHVVIHYHRRIVAMGTYKASVETQSQSLNEEAPDSEIGSSQNESIQERFSSSASPVNISVEQVITTSTHSAIDEKVSLCNVEFSRPHRGETEKLIVRRYTNKLLILCAFTIVLCVVIGCVLPSFSVDLLGLVGIAVEFGQGFEEATNSYSVFSVIQSLYYQASYLGTAIDYVGLFVLSVIYVSTIFVVPIIQSIALLYQWLSASNSERKRKISHRLEILQAWQYLEVFVVALLLSSWYVTLVYSWLQY